MTIDGPTFALHNGALNRESYLMFNLTSCSLGFAKSFAMQSRCLLDGVASKQRKDQCQRSAAPTEALWLGHGGATKQQRYSV